MNKKSISLFTALLLCLALLLSCVTSPAENNSPVPVHSSVSIEDIKNIKFFEGSISIGCVVSDGDSFGRELADELTEICKERNYHILSSITSEPKTAVSEFVAGGMDFVIVTGFSEEANAELPSLCEEKGTYPLFIGNSPKGEYAFAADNEKDAEAAAEYLLKYIFGIMIFGEDCPLLFEI